ncbi:MAG TPA: hypothetical protein VF550_11890 [Polyangia bacterium]
MVPAIDAIRSCSEEGCQELPEGQGLRLFDAMDRLAASGLRRFVSEARLSSFPLCELNDAKLRQMVRLAIRDRRLIALRKGQSAGKTTSKTVELRRLVKQIEQQTRGLLNYGGRQYKLVVDVDLGKVPGRNNYEVVGRDDARRVLDGLAKESGAAGDLATLLGQASAKVTPDWRPPITTPDGLILLRKNLAPTATASNSEPAYTPSQLNQQLGLVEKVHPTIDGTMVELDLSEVDLPTQSDESQPSDGTEQAEAAEPSSHAAGAEDSGESPHGS